MNKSTLGHQFIRATDSVVLNISEGFGRYTFREIRLYCYYARGSFHESHTCLKLAKARKLISEEYYQDMEMKFNLLGRKLNNYIKFLTHQIAESGMKTV